MSNQTEPLIAAAQWDIELGQNQKNLMYLERFAREAAAAGCKLLVLPELWTVSFAVADPVAYAMAVTAERFAQELSADLDLILVGSSLEKDGNKLFNRASVMFDGKVQYVYRKAHLFSPTGEKIAFASGDQLPACLETPLGSLSVMICYDLRFPAMFANIFEEQPDIVVIPAQWAAARLPHWRLLLQARAIENQTYIIGANRTGSETQGKQRITFPGHSMIIDPWGEILGELDENPGWVGCPFSQNRIAEARQALPIHRDRKSF